MGQDKGNARKSLSNDLAFKRKANDIMQTGGGYKTFKEQDAASSREMAKVKNVSAGRKKALTDVANTKTKYAKSMPPPLKGK